MYMPDFFLSLQNSTVLYQKMLSVTPYLGIHNITLTYKTGTLCLGLAIRVKYGKFGHQVNSDTHLQTA